MGSIAAIAGLVVTVLTQLLPLLGSTSTNQVASIINLLIQIIPTIVQEAADLVQPVQNIIAAL
ncbi:MAG: hypothetical protein JO107_05445, partial [Hyphomicrobiales bacterium]|nr:hypothetical protein [Hyphomicrobiales bacterium]MBV8662527.1 hypothetical protein [Hyphomicrobiales bacterium]